jgi:hypothetical protein
MICISHDFDPFKISSSDCELTIKANVGVTFESISVEAAHLLFDSPEAAMLPTAAKDENPVPTLRLGRCAESDMALASVEHISNMLPISGFFDITLNIFTIAN